MPTSHGLPKCAAVQRAQSPRFAPTSKSWTQPAIAAERRTSSRKLKSPEWWNPDLHPVNSMVNSQFAEGKFPFWWKKTISGSSSFMFHCYASLPNRIRKKKGKWWDFRVNIQQTSGKPWQTFSLPRKMMNFHGGLSYVYRRVKWQIIKGNRGIVPS